MLILWQYLLIGGKRWIRFQVAFTDGNLITREFPNRPTYTMPVIVCGPRILTNMILPDCIPEIRMAFGGNLQNSDMALKWQQFQGGVGD
jgi:hypothetical protein